MEYLIHSTVLIRNNLEDVNQPDRKKVGITMATQIFVTLKANKYGLRVHCTVAQMNIHFTTNGGFQLLRSQYRTLMWWFFVYILREGDHN